eukprot:2996650-Prymnesium_polylepis.1
MGRMGLRRLRVLLQLPLSMHLSSASACGAGAAGAACGGSHTARACALLRSRKCPTVFRA